MMDYPVVIVPLSDDQGGGYVGHVPDLKGCMSDGETPEEALRNTQDAIREWISESQRIGRNVPEPGAAARRAKRERTALVAALRTLENHYEGFDERIESLTLEMKELRERAEEFDAWQRFSTLTGVEVNETAEDIEEHC